MGEGRGRGMADGDSYIRVPNVVNTPATNVTIIFATKESQGNYMGGWEREGREGVGLLHQGS